MLTSHVPINELGPVAEEARAKHMVVAHYADLAQEPIDLHSWHKQAQRGYRGKVTIGVDLQKFSLGK